MVAGTFDTTLVSAPAGAQAQATQLVEAGEGTVLLYNTDPGNAVQLGGSNAVLANDQSGIAPLPPKSSIVFDGSEDVYATIGAGQTALIAAYPSAIQFQTTTLITPISQQGSLSGSGGFLTMSNPTQFYTIVPLTDVSAFQSYDLNLYVYASPAGGNLQGVALQIILQWFDDMVSGIPVFEEDWWVWQGRAAAGLGANSLAGTGPMHGRYMQVSAALPAAQTGNTIFQYFNLFGSNRTVPDSDWRQNQSTINPQIFNLTTTVTSQVVGTAFDNVLGGVNNLTIPANQATFVPLGLYSGPVYWRYQASAAMQTNPLICTIENAVGGTMVATSGCPNIVTTFVADASDHEGTILAPRAPMAFLVRAPASAADTFSFQAIAQQAA